MGDVALKDWLFQRLEEAIEIIKAQDQVLEQHGIKMLGGNVGKQRDALLEHMEEHPYFFDMPQSVRK